MFSIAKKMFNKGTKPNESSIKKAPQKSEEDKKKENIGKFLAKLEDIAWDLDDNSSFYCDAKSSKDFDKKESNACKAYGKGYSSVNPILLVDTTIFGKADEGMMFSRWALFIGEKDGASRKIDYENLFGKKFKVEGGSFYINNREHEFGASKEMKKLAPVIQLLNHYFSI